MNPVAFSIFGLDIKWYAILITFGIVIGAVIAMYEATRVGCDTEIIIDLLLYTIPTAVIGARAYYVAFEWGYYRHHLLEVFATRNGGLAIHGAVLGALISGYIFARVKKLSFLKLADITAPSLILGQAIGRWGNFINQEAHGGVVSEKFISYFPGFIQNQMYINGVYYNPTFLYESIWNFIVFIILFSYRKHKNNDGELIGLYFVLYSTGRFFIEGLRNDSLMFGPLRIAQVISLVFIILGIVLITYLRNYSTSSRPSCK